MGKKQPGKYQVDNEGDYARTNPKSQIIVVFSVNIRHSRVKYEGSAELKFVPDRIKSEADKRKLEVINLDKGYTSVELRRTLRRKGVYVNMKVKSGDYTRKRGPKFRFYEEKHKVRFLVEKVFGWLKNFKRIRLRKEYNPAMFKAFVYLGLILILLRN